MLADGTGATLTENEFVRRFAEQTRSNELIRYKHNRAKGLLATGGVLMVASAGLTISGIVSLTACPTMQTLANGNLLNLTLNNCVTGNGLFAVNARLSPGVAQSVLTPWLFWSGIVGSALSIGALIAGGVLNDGTAGEHEIPRSEIEGYVRRHNDALQANVVDAANEDPD